MLKKYVDRNSSASVVAQVVSVAAVHMPYDPRDDGLDDRCGSVSCARLRNLEVLKDLHAYLDHLSDPFREDICKLIKSHPTLFNDVPSKTNVLVHDIDVGQHEPIKQHAYRVHPAKRAAM